MAGSGREAGNAAYRTRDYAGAVRCYSIALRDGGQLSHADSTSLHTNRAAAYGACGMVEEALADADKAIALTPHHVKAHYRRGVSLMGLHRYREAAESLQMAEALEPRDRDIAHQLRLAREYLALDESIREAIPFAPFPVEAGYLPTKGRALFATRTLEPGDLLLRCAPTAAVLDDDCLLRYCSRCFAPLARLEQQELRPCADCGQYVVCPGCTHDQEERAIHAGECRVMQAFPRPEDGSAGHQDIRLALRMLLYRSRGHKRGLAKGTEANRNSEEDEDEGEGEKAKEGETERWRVQDDGEAAFDGRSLVEHHDQLGAEVREGFRQQACNLRWFAAHEPALALALSDSDDQRLSRLFAVAQANALALSDPSTLRRIGQGLYASAALLNHSCQPNANWSVDEEGMLCVRAVSKVAAGEEVTVAYIDPAQPYHERQRELQETFSFSCRCPQCHPVPLALRDYFVADELMVMVKCPNTMESPSVGDEDAEEGKEEVSICGHGMVTIAVQPPTIGGGSGENAAKDSDNVEGRLECVECGYELPGDYAQSVARVVTEKALARLTGDKDRRDKQQGDDGEEEDDDDDGEYRGLVEGVEEGMSLLHPCHQMVRTMVEHLLFAAHARGDGVMEVYAAQTLVNTLHAYLRHQRLHLHVALLHLFSGHALLRLHATSSPLPPRQPSSSSPSSSPSPSLSQRTWSRDESPLRLGLPSVFAERLVAERENWAVIGAEYISMANRQLKLRLGPRHWLSRSTLSCVQGRCSAHQPCPLLRAYFQED